MTFSVCLREETDEGPVFGIGIATDAPAVGALAPHVSTNGAISTQSFVNVRLGRDGIDIIKDLTITDALQGLLNQDDRHDLRQVHGLDAQGNAFAFSGDNCDDWFGHQVHEDNGITAAGNMLTGPETLDALVDTVQTTSDGVGERLLEALAAGRDAGGDKRGHTSAALLVKAPQTTAYHDLRVDCHDTPIDELNTVYEQTKAESQEFNEESMPRIFD